MARSGRPWTRRAVGWLVYPRAALLAVLSLVAWSLEAAEAAQCSSECAAEFVGACVPFQASRLGDAGAAYAACETQLRNGQGPMSQKCTDAA